MVELIGRIYMTFVYESRFLFFLDGLWMTLLLTISSFLIGTLIGALFCAMKRSRHAWLRRVVTSLVSLLVNLPTMVLLMLFVYIIFVKLPVSVVVCVILGLTIKTGAYMCDIFHTALTAVDRGEIEAAHTLGMTRRQIFCYITLPQAVNMALPVYKNQFVITLQETSIVGYLAIMDLTRASEIVTSRTLDALFGLVIISLLYLLIGYLGNLLLGLLGRRTHLGGDAT